MGIQQVEIFTNGYEIHDGQIMKSTFFPKIAIPVSDDVFDVVKIGLTRNLVLRRSFWRKYGV